MIWWDILKQLPEPLANFIEQWEKWGFEIKTALSHTSGFPGIGVSSTTPQQVVIVDIIGGEKRPKVRYIYLVEDTSLRNPTTYSFIGQLDAGEEEIEEANRYILLVTGFSKKATEGSKKWLEEFVNETSYAEIVGDELLIRPDWLPSIQAGESSPYSPYINGFKFDLTAERFCMRYIIEEEDLREWLKKQPDYAGVVAQGSTHFEDELERLLKYLRGNEVCLQPDHRAQTPIYDMYISTILAASNYDMWEDMWG